MVRIQVQRGKTFRLRVLKNGLHQIHVSDGGPAFEGSEVAIEETAVALGVDRDDLIVAKREIQANNHNWADFGIFGRFLYTGE